MASDPTRSGLEGELSQAITELQAALQHVGAATESIRVLLPKVASINGMLDELDTVIRVGLHHLGTDASPSPAYARPTLVVASAPAPSTANAAEWSPSGAATPAPEAT